MTVQMCDEVQSPAAQPDSSMPSEAEAQLRAEVQQLRMQLQERDAKEQQLLGEVAALKVCTFDGIAVRQFS